MSHADLEPQLMKEETLLGTWNSIMLWPEREVRKIIKKIVSEATFKCFIMRPLPNMKVCVLFKQILEKLLD